MRVYQFKVSIIGISGLHRIIEATENCTFSDLHEAIFHAFDKYDPHLYSFFMTKQDTKSLPKIYASPEITHPDNVVSIMSIERKRKSACQTLLSSVGLEENDIFHYLFDFGDDWWHRIEVLSIIDIPMKNKYIRMIRAMGISPPQYPEYAQTALSG
ncbi:MAG: hypothetical protein PVI90_01250 [Desulfobacteraceae bacterium]|jgi:hypothetical protein